jgi:hypothetical protein
MMGLAVVRMRITPHRSEHQIGPGLAENLDYRTVLGWITTVQPRIRQVEAKSLDAEHPSGGSRLARPLLRSAGRRPLPAGQVGDHHSVPVGDRVGKSAARRDLDVIGMGPESKQDHGRIIAA